MWSFFGNEKPQPSEAEAPASSKEQTGKISLVDSKSSKSSQHEQLANDEEAEKKVPSKRVKVTKVKLTEEEVRKALLDLVDLHCCWGRKPARKMEFSEIVASSAYHYILETFGEGRETEWASEPWKKDQNMPTGFPPGPWEVRMNPPELFVNYSKVVEIPNTAQMQMCDKCNMKGSFRCDNCGGDGTVRCRNCGGDGRIYNRRSDAEGRDTSYYSTCGSCNGRGRVSCGRCGGSGKITCSKCQGQRFLRMFIELKVTWTNHKDEYIFEQTPLPNNLIKEVNGELALLEVFPRVEPFDHFPADEVNEASNRMIKSHGSEFKEERILMQRHCVRIVPVTQAFYKYKEKDGHFFIYGQERRVYAPDYPAQCCCGCNIL